MANGPKGTWWPIRNSRAAHGPRPPGLFFHGLATLTALGYLWAFSVPGLMFDVWLGAWAATLVLSVTWLALGVRYWWLRRRGGVPVGRARWFLAGPLGAALLLGLLFGQVSLQIRFRHARHSFDEAVLVARPTPTLGGPNTGVPTGRFGTFDITHGFVQGKAVIFYEEHGAFLDDAGFAYLPDGPTPDLGDGSWESPQFRHLVGDWYAWTASW